jgi:hypothetical protein
MSRKKRLTLAGVAGGLALLLGSGLIAIVSDSVTSEANSLESGTFTRPAHDVQAGKSSSDRCSDVEYSDGPISAALQSPIDLGTSSSGVNQQDAICVMNTGTSTARLSAAFVNVSDTESAPCDESESSAGDTSCGDGDSGELKSIVHAEWQNCAGDGSDNFCNLSLVPFADHEAPRDLDVSLEPGESRWLRLYTVISHAASEDERLRAQTDRLQWDIVFTLQDA